MGFGTDHRQLARMIATLLALAVLAERAAGRSWPVRVVVLAILRHAAAVATVFVADAMAWHDLRAAPDGGDALLASRLRLLAAALTTLLQWECLMSCRPIAALDASEAAPGLVLVAVSRRFARAIDTS